MQRLSPAALKAINQRNASHLTPLHTAVKSQRSQHVRLLLMSQVRAECLLKKQRNIRFSLVKAQLNVGDDRGRTALHLAVYENALTCVQAILEINVLKTTTYVWRG